VAHATFQHCAAQSVVFSVWFGKVQFFCWNSSNFSRSPDDREAARSTFEQTRHQHHGTNHHTGTLKTGAKQAWR
jgi:hypothetical protein